MMIPIFVAMLIGTFLMDATNRGEASPLVIVFALGIVALALVMLAISIISLDKLHCFVHISLRNRNGCFDDFRILYRRDGSVLARSPTGSGCCKRQFHPTIPRLSIRVVRRIP
jgi:hypothetical protein